MTERILPDFDPDKIARSGQCFRMHRKGDGWFLIAFDRYLSIQPAGKDRFQFSCDEEEFELIWRNYFDLDGRYDEIKDRIARDDVFLNRAYDYSRGMRILRQDPWEVTLSFILSQRKSIPAIQSTVEKLCERYGEERNFEGMRYYTFPRPERLVSVTCEDLRTCSTGYRDQYVRSAAAYFATHTAAFDEMRTSGEDAARARLKEINGIGEKVSNCILLFGLGYRDAFPEDTWILRVVRSEYSGVFPKERYRGILGIIQQYMFFYGRCAEYRELAPLNALQTTG